jgi:hypothetical protein
MWNRSKRYMFVVQWGNLAWSYISGSHQCIDGIESQRNLWDCLGRLCSVRRSNKFWRAWAIGSEQRKQKSTNKCWNGPIVVRGKLGKNDSSKTGYFKKARCSQELVGLSESETHSWKVSLFWKALFFFSSTVVWTQGLTLVRCSIAWATPPALFHVGYFWDRVLQTIFQVCLQPWSSWSLPYE